MMNALIEKLISGIESTPDILSELLSHIPKERMKVQPRDGVWSIHEHACHIASGDPIGFLDRLDEIETKDNPKMVPFSGESFPPDYLLTMDLEVALKQFYRDRADVIRRAKGLSETLWAKEAYHPEYIHYTPFIMLRHRLMHDHYHMYKIEDLWLNRNY